MKVKCNCIICNKEFYRRNYVITHKTCSRVCKGLAGRVTKISKNCEVCDKEFTYRPKELKHRAVKYCSLKCSYIPSKSTIPKIISECKTCKKEISFLPSERKIFCSRQCTTNKKTFEEKLSLLVERFHTKYKKINDCLIWQGAKNQKGYGLIGWLGSSKLAHRIAWMLANKPEIPKNKMLMHSCNSPACVEITHLSIGTAAENSKFMMESGRYKYDKKCYRGKENYMAKITEETARTIKKLLYEKTSIDIAKYLGISIHIVNGIRSGRTWTHIDLGVAKDIPYFKYEQIRILGEENLSSKLKERQIREIKIKLLNGESQRGIARQYNISQAVISAINTGKTWSHVKIDEKSDSSNDSDTRSHDIGN